MTSSGAPARVDRSAYEGAERFLPWNLPASLLCLVLEPRWLGRTDHFWYERRDGAATRYVLVDPDAGERREIDAEELAGLIGRAPGEPEDGLEVASPDGLHIAFVRGHDLWVRERGTGEEFAVTMGGTAESWYGAPLPSPLAAAGLQDPAPPTIVWSPDGSRLLTHRIDRMGSPGLPFLQSVPLDGSRRPRVHTVSYPLPGDEITPVARAVIVDPVARLMVLADHEPIPLLHYGSPLSGGRAAWSTDGERVTVVVSDRGSLGFRMLEIRADTGASRELVAEESPVGTFPDAGNWATLENTVSHVAFGDGPEVLWRSERDGWSHLYLYDLGDGARPAPRQLTAGDWFVNHVVHLDADRREVLFTASGREPGRDPYLSLLYRVPLDGGEPVLLTDDDADHRVSASPSGRHLVVTASRWDSPPVTTLIGADGRVILELERADVSALTATGWVPPRRVTVKARDGETDVYGLVFTPTVQAPDDVYPILDFIYAGPQTNQAGTSFADSARHVGEEGIASNFWHAQALAELGFAVVMIDGLGMPGRSGAFADVAWKNLADGGIPDHIEAYRQLAAADPRLDATRVGIFGHSAGGYASAQAILAHPDVYAACVSSAGNHDHRLDKASWVERYMGLPVGEHYAAQANGSLASNLRGKLLLAHGDMDENVHVASTLSLVDALIDANKDFDLLILPNRPHRFGDDPYFTRRRWDHFVRHVLGAEPPLDYRISKN